MRGPACMSTCMRFQTRPVPWWNYLTISAFHRARCPSCELSRYLRPKGDFICTSVSTWMLDMRLSLSQQVQQHLPTCDTTAICLQNITGNISAVNCFIKAAAQAMAMWAVMEHGLARDDQSKTHLRLCPSCPYHTHCVQSGICL